MSTYNRRRRYEVTTMTSAEGREKQSHGTVFVRSHRELENIVFLMLSLHGDTGKTRNLMKECKALTHADPTRHVFLDGEPMPVLKIRYEGE